MMTIFVVVVENDPETCQRYCQNLNRFIQNSLTAILCHNGQNAKCKI